MGKLVLIVIASLLLTPFISASFAGEELTSLLRTQVQLERRYQQDPKDVQTLIQLADAHYYEAALMGKIGNAQGMGPSF